MQLKTYRANDLQTALTRARAECGPDALVLATNEVHGRLGLTTIEITVALDREPAPAPAPAAGALQRLARHVATGGTTNPTGAVGAREAPAEPPAAPQGTDLDPMLRSAVDALVRSGLSEDLALRFAHGASARSGVGRGSDDLSDAAERGMRGLLRFAPPRLEEGSVVFVVGPPGAGKTSTVTKLATRLAAEGRGPVVVADADDPHGAEDGKLRHEIRLRRDDVTVERIEAADDLRRIVARQAGRGITLVDTAGVGAADEDRLRALRGICRSILEAEVLLVIPAGLHREEVRRIARRFTALHPTAAVMSRVDDGGLLGEIVSGVAAIDLPLALLSTGRRVPNDLEDASPRRLAALLLRSGFERGVESTESPV